MIMNALEQFIIDRNLTAVTGKVKLNLTKETRKEFWSFVRVLCDTKTGQQIYLKYFEQYKNFRIEVSPSAKGLSDGFYISEFDIDWVLVENFQKSLDNFIKKGPSLVMEPIDAIEV